MTFVEPRFDAAFARVVRALEPYLGDLVFVGGVASALYRRHSLASEAALKTVLTKDVDLATGGVLSYDSRELIADLLRLANLEVERNCDTVPPLTKFVERNADDPIEVEFPPKWYRDALKGLERSFVSGDAPGAFEAAEEYTAATGTTSVVTPERVRESIRRLVDALHAHVR